MAGKMQVGSIGWLDLTVDDAEGLRDFYSAVVGWSHEPVSMGDYDDHVMTAADGTHTAGVCNRRGMNSAALPQWMVYIVVAELDASVAEVEARGGEVIERRTAFAVIRDPAGAVCALYQQPRED